MVYSCIKQKPSKFAFILSEMTPVYITFYITFIALVDSSIPEDNVLKLNNELRQKLSEEQKNADCCKKKMRCCKQRLDPPDIEIRAILVRCPRNSCNNEPNKPLYKRSEEEGFDEDEPLSFSDVSKCNKKLLVTMRIRNAGPTNCKNVFVVVDHVYDPVTSTTARLLNPYVIKIKQEPITALYKLHFQHVVNSEAKEVVYNKHSGNYTGCDTTSARPTCGVVKFNGQVVPYSTGFCCSCDALVNSRRQPDSGLSPAIVSSNTDPLNFLENVQCPKNLVRPSENGEHLTQEEKTIDNINQVLEKKVERADSTKEAEINDDDAKLPENNRPQDQRVNIEGVVLSDPSSENLFFRKIKNEEGETNPTGEKLTRKVDELQKLLNDQLELESQAAQDVLSKKERRQVSSSGNQRRGGQNCADRYTPHKLDPITYHESTHCLKFSDLWYTVYQLQEPFLEHSFYIQIFEKHEDNEGHTRWRDLSKGKMIRMGMFNPFYRDEDATIAFHYKSKVIKPEEGQSINCKNARLLVPEGTSTLDPGTFPEITGGPAEYLVVQQNQVSMDGDQCSIAGVGYEAFFKQPNRCSVRRGTCLENQPRHLWLHDRQAERMGRPGCFFLKYYGSLSKEPIRQNTSGQDRFLALDYAGMHYSTVDMEIKADFNTVLLKNAPARITEVYVDSTSAYTTILTIKITNAGLISAMFYVGLVDCPLELPTALNSIKAKPVLIAPQTQHVFTLQINLDLPVDRFHCSVEAFNERDELTAVRRIRIQKFDRCICTWHCLCSCLGSLEGLKCRPMSLEHYHAAGFQGALPIATTLQKYTLADEIISGAFYFMLFLLMTLLILGVAKAVVGCLFCTVIGIWGLDLLLGLPRKMRCYYEPELQCREVEYDHFGWPIHPCTKKRVRNISKITEFCMNLVFFYMYPVTILLMLIKRICCPYYIYEQDDDGSITCCDKRSRRVSFEQCCKSKLSVQDLLKKRFSCSDSNRSEGIISFEDITESDRSCICSRTHYS